LQVLFTNVPQIVGSDPGDVPVLHRAGRLQLGNADGFLPPVQLTSVATLLYPLPDALTLLSWTLAPGAVAVATELVSSSVASLKQPWDRNATPFGYASTPFVFGGTGLVTTWSFTVPAGRLLYVSSARVSIRRTAAASAVGIDTAQISSGFGYLASAALYSNVIGDSQSDQLQGAPLIIPAGFVVSGGYNNSDTGGQIGFEIAMTGFTFDAV
jgi:hypothetical protein